MTKTKTIRYEIYVTVNEDNREAMIAAAEDQIFQLRRLISYSENVRIGRTPTVQR